MVIRMNEVKYVMGNSDSSLRPASSRRRRPWPEMVGMKFWTLLRSILPASLLNSQLIKACMRSSLELKQREHTSEDAGVSWFSLTLLLIMYNVIIMY